MVFVRFEDPFDFTPDADRRITVAYKPGTEANVTRECVAKAEAKGVRFVMLKKDSDNGSHGVPERNRPAEGEGEPGSEDRPATDDGSGESEREGA